VVIALWNYCCVLFAWNQCIKISLFISLTLKWIFWFQNSSTEHYQYTSKADVIKLSFWVRWHVMLLMCCRLQELEVRNCDGMTDRTLLEGIGSLHELTSLHLLIGHRMTAQALSTFLHRPFMTSMLSVNLSFCRLLDDEGLKGISTRYNNLTFLHV